jgi:DNA-directed RNA polymerase specialized sigma24 family protein
VSPELEDLSDKEIARIADIPIGTVISGLAGIFRPEAERCIAQP